MGKCSYCGNSAGFLRSKHAECEDEARRKSFESSEGRMLIVSQVSRAIRFGDDFSELEQTIANIESAKSVHPYERKALLAKGWADTVESFLEDGILDKGEEERLVKFMSEFQLSQKDLDINGAYARTAKSSILREILDGNVPETVSIDGQLPINFQKGERIVFAFPNSVYLEDKIKRQYLGRSQGASIRVMKGVYYRIGSFKGHTVERTERTYVDSGWVVVTDKNLYFAGPTKSLRIPYSKILTFEPFSDGIGIMRDTATAKPQIFVTGDGWFTYNLVVNLAQL